MGDTLVQELETRIAMLESAVFSLTENLQSLEKDIEPTREYQRTLIKMFADKKITYQPGTQLLWEDVKDKLLDFLVDSNVHILPSSLPSLIEDVLGWRLHRSFNHYYYKDLAWK